MATTNQLGLAQRWRFVLRTGNLPRGPTDAITRWLVITRAAVFPMTLTAGAFAGLLAAYHGNVNWWLFSLAALGLVVSHASNNLMNDLFDLRAGSDSANYPRALYAPHPILSGLVTTKGLWRAAVITNVLGLLIAIVLVAARGWPVVAFALAGFVLSYGYTAPPLRLKKRGLGEPTVLIVWGPLMVGGTYFIARGVVDWGVMAASIPYALLCTSVLFGKHIDKIEWDENLGVRTMPVMLGERRARTVCAWLIIGFYVAVALLVASQLLPVGALVSFLALKKLPKTLTVLRAPRPVEPPPNYPVWPLWFAPHVFLHTRAAGGKLIFGMLFSVVFAALS